MQKAPPEPQLDTASNSEHDSAPCFLPITTIRAAGQLWGSSWQSPSSPYFVTFTEEERSDHETSEILFGFWVWKVCCGFLSPLKFFHKSSQQPACCVLPPSCSLNIIGLNMYSAISSGNLKLSTNSLNLQAMEAKPEVQKHWPNYAEAV